MLLFIFLLVVSSKASADEIPYRAVRIIAAAGLEHHSAIRLQWNKDSTANNYLLFRKKPTENNWTSIAEVGFGANYTDSSIELAQEYEYQVVKTGVRKGLEYSTGGYISAGIEIPFDEFRGAVALVIDSLVNNSLNPDILNLISDIEGDGWRVWKVIVGRSESFSGKMVRAVKKEIQRIYNSDSALRAVLLIGRIPVPYSGNFVVDDHEEHLGAWPADCYYGDVYPSPIDERWSDLYVNQISAEREANRNRRLDGKFDQSEIPSDIELAVGRVDFSDLPTSGISEIEMIRRYLLRNHNYRHGVATIKNAACIWDRFDVLGSEMFAQSAYSNSTSLFGDDKIFTERWLGKSSDSAFQFGYAAGPGSYTSCWDIGDIHDAAQGVNAVFCGMIGSYYGDWDNPDNLLRSTLGGNHALAVWWSGRPQWQLHRCASGQPLVASVLATINNDGLLYDAGRYTRGAHIALLGDPTLRFFPIRSPENLTVTIGDSVTLRWDATNDDIAGYAIYRNDGDGFKRLNAELITTNFYAEKKNVNFSNNTKYMARAVKLQQTPSGSFWNPSAGVISAPIAQGIDKKNAPKIPDIIVAPQPIGEFCLISMSDSAPNGSSIEIIDMLGRIVATPERLENNKWLWNANKVAPGAYLIKIFSQNNERYKLIFKE